MSVNVKVTTYLNDQSAAQSETREDLLSDSSTLLFPVPLQSTFDDIFHLCTRRCGISPLYLPLFALRDTNSKWIKLGVRLENFLQPRSDDNNINQELQQEDINVELRVRFTFKSECDMGGVQRQAHRYSSHDDSSKPVMNEKVVKYFFHQRRSDFLKGKLAFLETQKDETGAALGVAVLDLLRLACEMKCGLKSALSRVRGYRKLLPVTCREELRSMNVCNRFRVDLKFKHYLRHFMPNCDNWLESGWSPAYFYCRYLRNLELVVGSSDMETYDLIPGSNAEDFSQITIGADCGIVKGKNDSDEQWSEFHDITDMKIQVRRNDSQTVWIISISQINGKILNLSLDNRINAENLASGIDGYYQLLTDPHHYLCRDVASPSLVERLSCYCHGPISCAYAESCIRKQPQIQVGDCLLRQSQESFDEYFINTVTETHPSIVIKNYKLDRVMSEDGSKRLGIFGDGESHWHPTLSSLVDACSDGQHNGNPVPFQIIGLIHPDSKHQSTLKVYRCSDSHNLEEDGGRRYANAGTPSTAIIMQKDYSYLQLLGAGKYSDVKLYVNKKAKEHKVVIKKVYEPQERYELGMKQHVEESFQDSMYMLNFLKNDHIVHLVGTMKNMMVLEYVPRGSITDYLQKISAVTTSPRPNESTPRPTEWSSWFLYVLWQLTHACNYLEEKDCAHGNIRGKNVLLWQDLPQPHIKLADPGVRTCSRTINHQQNIAEPVLPAPWLASEFCKIDSEMPASNYPTVNGDKWGYATTVCEICDWGNLSVEPQSAYQLSDNMKHGYVTGEVMAIPGPLSSSSELTSLIRQCWSIYPRKRPAFKKVLRELGTVLASDYVLPSVEPTRHFSDSDDVPTVVPDLQTFEDAHLVFIRQLGEGHFGHVDLYTYDRYGGRAERVAVKSLRRTMSNPQSTCDFNNEIETMRKLSHQYVVKLKGVAEPSLRIVMEFLPYGSLTRYLKTQRDSNVQLPSLYKMLLEFSSQISQGMLALQEKRLIHRDLALRNILLARKGLHTRYYVKISDFGLSRTLKEDSDYYRGNPNEFPAQWYAPECLRDDSHTAFHFESDVWSFGVTVWEMFSYGERPTYESLPDITLRNLSQLQERLKEGTRLPQPAQCPARVYSLIRRCWAYEPSERIKFEELRQNFDDLTTRYH